mmetsp:Transcript_7265/g.19477  ORF Transcript_7265/g.19477 Transcript_7265/m.19477 type:complete len:109 (+) Transcript_7265:156-482(+)
MGVRATKPQGPMKPEVQEARRAEAKALPRASLCCARSTSGSRSGSGGSSRILGFLASTDCRTSRRRSSSGSRSGSSDSSAILLAVLMQLDDLINVQATGRGGILACCQ